MSRILTGIQSTGTPHLGNILGAIVPAIKMSNESKFKHTLQQWELSERLRHQGKDQKSLVRKITYKIKIVAFLRSRYVSMRGCSRFFFLKKL